MNNALVAVVDSTKARFLTLTAAEFPEERAGARLVELEGLFNPLNEEGRELWSTTKTGRNRGVSGQAHSYDDHRDDHRVEFERRFTQDIVTRVADLIDTNQIRHLILVAEPHITGLMREAIALLGSSQLQIHELTKNLCYLKPHDLHKYLAGQGLLPEPVRIMD